MRIVKKDFKNSGTERNVNLMIAHIVNDILTVMFSTIVIHKRNVLFSADSLIVISLIINNSFVNK